MSTLKTILKWAFRILLFPIWIIWTIGMMDVKLECERVHLFNMVVENTCRSCGNTVFNRAGNYVGTNLFTGEHLRDLTCPECGSTLFVQDMKEAVK